MHAMYPDGALERRDATHFEAYGTPLVGANNNSNKFAPCHGKTLRAPSPREIFNIEILLSPHFFRFIEIALSLKCNPVKGVHLHMLFTNGLLGPIFVLLY